MSRRATSNRNERGNTADRRIRRDWLFNNFTADFGGGDYVRCYRCGTLLTKSTMTVDRIVPGKLGGKYVRENIRPACGACNKDRGESAIDLPLDNVRDMLRSMFTETMQAAGVELHEDLDSDKVRDALISKVMKEIL